jgi:predicted nucleic-acid-binding Zn-ribbon protein
MSLKELYSDLIESDWDYEKNDDEGFDPNKMKPRSYKNVWWKRDGLRRIDHRVGEYDFIERSKVIHGNKFDYDKVKYEGNRKKVIVICSKHGEFLQTPSNHMFLKQGCPKCKCEEQSKLKSLTSEQFIQRSKQIHGERYDYSSVRYVRAKIHVEIICKTHGPFQMRPNNHISSKNGCPKCTHNRYSHAAIEWLEDIMKTEGIHIQHAENGGEKRIEYLPQKYMYVDGFDADTNTVYEFHGSYFHGCVWCHIPSDVNPTTKKTYGELYTMTKKKEERIKNLGYNLITKWECGCENN